MLLGSSEQRLGILLNILQHTAVPTAVPTGPTAKTYLAHNVKSAKAAELHSRDPEEANSGWEPRAQGAPSLCLNKA